MKRVAEEVHDLQHDTKRQQAVQAKAAAELRREMQTRGEHTSQLLESIHTGGLSMSMAGLLWLAVGVVLTSVPDLL